MKTKLFLVILITSCQFDYRGEKYIDDEIKPYWESFQADAERLGVQLPNKTIIMYLDPEISPEDNGLCYSENNYSKIKLNPARIKPGTYQTDVEATIYHELAHALLGRHHLEPEGEIEESLMTIPHNGRKGWNDGTMREYYLKELFGIIKNN